MNAGTSKRVIYVCGNGWIQSHEDTPCGRGRTTFTRDRTRAITFDSVGDAFEYWDQQSKTVPMRPDGEPNRPLTAFTVEILPVDRDPVFE